MPIRANQDTAGGVSRCAQCGRAADQRCSRCRDTYYCGRDHQREHWAAHRALCSPYKVARDAVLGRHLVATRDLPAGACVLREAPVATGPPSGARAPVCVACYTPLGAAAAAAASPPPLCPRGCGWPVCDERCARHPRHRPECELQLARANGKLDVVGALRDGHPVHRALTVARCLLLKDSDPAAYERLRDLEAHCARRRASGQWERERRCLAQFMLPFFGLDGRFTEDDVLYMAGVLQINTYPVRVRDPPPFVAVYNEASFIEHACVPNTAKVFGAGGEILLRTAAPVRKGEHLSICYVEAALGTAPRRANLKEELLECQCGRCLDPTELGTAFSALLCPDESCEGAVLPENPVCEAFVEDPALGGPWRCKACQRLVPAADAETLVQAAAQAAVSLPPTELLSNAVSLRLKPTHYLLLPARVAAIAAVADAPAQRSDSELRAAERQLKELRTLVDSLLPAEVGLRGHVVFAQYAILHEREVRCARSAGVSAKEIASRLQESKKLLQEAVTLLRDHADSSIEGLLFKRAERLLDTFGSYCESSLPSLKGKEVAVNGSSSSTSSVVAVAAAAAAAAAAS